MSTNPYIIPDETIKVESEGSFWNGFTSNKLAQQCVFFDDFLVFSGSGGWTITETDAGATEALTSGANGLLLITNTAADNDIVSIQSGGSGGATLSFVPASGRKIWFECSLKVNDATQSEIAVGLLVTNTDPFAATPFGGTEGIIFNKVDSSTSVNCFMTNASVPSGLSAIGTMANNTFAKFGFVVNGIDSVDVWFNGDLKGTITSPLASVALRPTIALKNGEAVAKTMTVDYISVAQTRDI